MAFLVLKYLFPSRYYYYTYDIIADKELQNFANELSADGIGSVGGMGMVGSITKLETITEHDNTLSNTGRGRSSGGGGQKCPSLKTTELMQKSYDSAIGGRKCRRILKLKLLYIPNENTRNELMFLRHFPLRTIILLPQVCRRHTIVV